MRIHNFSAGPSVLPVPVLEKAAAQLMNYGDAGMSVMEMSHRSKAFTDIYAQMVRDLSELLELPDNYRLLFMQGGATSQFSAVPLNLLRNGKADYVNTGSWSKKAIAEAKKYGDIRVAATSEDKQFTEIPVMEGDWYRKDADYVHITSNNTIFGTAFDTFPDTGDVPLVADMSSDFLSRPIDVSKFGLIYAGAQKNAGCAGVTVIIIREDLLGHAKDDTPLMLDYQIHADKDSMYNTPPTYAMYIGGLVYAWLLEHGGLAAMEKRNQAKAERLYTFLDQSSLFRAQVAPPHRSLMNIPFSLPDDAMNAKFIKASIAQGMANLKGHRSVGGMRASLYNALPEASVEALVAFMADFEKEHG